MIKLSYPNTPQNTVSIALAIGNFDGVHLGHQAILNAINQYARAQNIASGAMFFDPPPRVFFGNPQSILTHTPQKSALLSGHVHQVFCVDFASIAMVSANDFIHWLKQLGVVAVCVGHDFAFGQNRSGTVHDLARHFELILPDDVLLNGTRISSTGIRKALASADLTSVRAMMGRDFSLSGRVVHGDGLGKQLGFATANLDLGHAPPLSGVFGVKVLGAGHGGGLPLDDGLFGALILGARPSLNDTHPRIEVHLPNFNANLYGRHLTVDLLHFLHPLQKYAGFDDLRQGIAHDVCALLAWYRHHS